LTDVVGGQNDGMKRVPRLEGVPAKAVLAVVLVCFLSSVVHWLSQGPAVPQITFVQVSRMPALAELTDPSDVVYSFIRPPIYELLDWVYTVPAAFALLGLVCHGVFNLLVFALAHRALRRIDAPASPFAHWMTALLVTVSVYPLGLLLGIAGWGTTLVPHDTYCTFSFRTFFWILAVLGFVLALERRWGAALLVMALSCYPHPSAGVTAFGLLTLMAIPRMWRLRERRLVVMWAVAAILGALPNLVKYLLVDVPPELTGSMPYGDWYSQIIKDEADDFSILFQLANRGPTVAVILVTLGAALGSYAWLTPGFRRHMCFWCTASVPGLFFLAALAEYLFAVLYPTPLVHVISAMTLGYRLLSYAFPPFVVLFARVLAACSNRAYARAARHRSMRFLADARLASAAVGIVILAVWAAFLVVGHRRALLGPSIAYARWALGSRPVRGIDAYFVATREAGANRYYQPRVFHGAEGFRTYPGVRSIFTIAGIDRTQPECAEDHSFDQAKTLESFVELVQAVRVAIPEGEGLYVPLHMRHFRDALPRHPIYLQEHPDGNLMVVSRAITRFWLERMEDLVGLSYEDMPSKDSGLMYTVLRNAYLSIDDEKLRELRQKYPAYRYFITEKDHSLDFQPAVRTRAFVVYDLSKSEGSAHESR
jgi:hypothetical protein